MYILGTELPKYVTLVRLKPIIAHNSEHYSIFKKVLKLYSFGFRIEEEMTIIQDNLKRIKLGRKHKSTYIKELKSHPEVYKPFLIIMVTWPETLRGN